LYQRARAALTSELRLLAGPHIAREQRALERAIKKAETFVIAIGLVSAVRARTKNNTTRDE
jgi:hypothetical protein